MEVGHHFFRVQFGVSLNFMLPGRQVEETKIDSTREGRDVCVLLKRKKAESEAQRGKPKGTLESESRNAIVQ